MSFTNPLLDATDFIIYFHRNVASIYCDSALSHHKSVTTKNFDLNTLSANFTSFEKYFHTSPQLSCPSYFGCDPVKLCFIIFCRGFSQKQLESDKNSEYVNQFINNVCKIDVLEMLCGLIVFSNGSIQDKSILLFSLFDIDYSGNLSLDEIGMMLSRCLSALSKFKLAFKIQDHLIQYFCQNSLKQRSGLDRDEFIDFITSDPMIKQLLDEIDCICRLITVVSEMRWRVCRLKQIIELSSPVNSIPESKMLMRYCNSTISQVFGILLHVSSEVAIVLLTVDCFWDKVDVSLRLRSYHDIADIENCEYEKDEMFSVHCRGQMKKNNVILRNLCQNMTYTLHFDHGTNKNTVRNECLFPSLPLSFKTCFYDVRSVMEESKVNLSLIVDIQTVLLRNNTIKSHKKSLSIGFRNCLHDSDMFFNLASYSVLKILDNQLKHFKNDPQEIMKSHVHDCIESSQLNVIQNQLSQCGPSGSSKINFLIEERVRFDYSGFPIHFNSFFLKSPKLILVEFDKKVQEYVNVWVEQVLDSLSSPVRLIAIRDTIVCLNIPLADVMDDIDCIRGSCMIKKIIIVRINVRCDSFASDDSDLIITTGMSGIMLVYVNIDVSHLLSTDIGSKKMYSCVQYHLTNGDRIVEYKVSSAPKEGWHLVAVSTDDVLSLCVNDDNNEIDIFVCGEIVEFGSDQTIEYIRDIAPIEVPNTVCEVGRIILGPMVVSVHQNSVCLRLVLDRNVNEAKISFKMIGGLSSNVIDHITDLHEGVNLINVGGLTSDSRYVVQCQNVLLHCRLITEPSIDSTCDCVFRTLSDGELAESSNDVRDLFVVNHYLSDSNGLQELLKSMESNLISDSRSGYPVILHVGFLESELRQESRRLTESVMSGSMEFDSAKKSITDFIHKMLLKSGIASLVRFGIHVFANSNLIGNDIEMFGNRILSSYFGFHQSVNIMRKVCVTSYYFNPKSESACSSSIIGNVMFVPISLSQCNNFQSNIEFNKLIEISIKYLKVQSSMILMVLDRHIDDSAASSGFFEFVTLWAERRSKRDLSFNLIVVSHSASSGKRMCFESNSFKMTYIVLPDHSSNINNSSLCVNHDFSIIEDIMESLNGFIVGLRAFISNGKQIIVNDISDPVKSLSFAMNNMILGPLISKVTCCSFCVLIEMSIDATMTLKLIRCIDRYERIISCSLRSWKCLTIIIPKLLSDTVYDVQISIASDQCDAEKVLVNHYVHTMKVNQSASKLCFLPFDFIPSVATMSESSLKFMQLKSFDIISKRKYYSGCEACISLNDNYLSNCFNNENVKSLRSRYPVLQSDEWSEFSLTASCLAIGRNNDDKKPSKVAINCKEASMNSFLTNSFDCLRRRISELTLGDHTKRGIQMITSLGCAIPQDIDFGDFGTKMQFHEQLNQFEECFCPSHTDNVNLLVAEEGIDLFKIISAEDDEKQDTKMEIGDENEESKSIDEVDTSRLEGLGYQRAVVVDQLEKSHKKGAAGLVVVGRMTVVKLDLASDPIEYYRTREKADKEFEKDQARILQGKSRKSRSGRMYGHVLNTSNWSVLNVATSSKCSCGIVLVADESIIGNAFEKDLSMILRGLFDWMNPHCFTKGEVDKNGVEQDRFVSIVLYSSESRSSSNVMSYSVLDTQESNAGKSDSDFGPNIRRSNDKISMYQLGSELFLPLSIIGEKYSTNAVNKEINCDFEFRLSNNALTPCIVPQISQSLNLNRKATVLCGPIFGNAKFVQESMFSVETISIRILIELDGCCDVTFKFIDVLLREEFFHTTRISANGPRIVEMSELKPERRYRFELYGDDLEYSEEYGYFHTPASSRLDEMNIVLVSGDDSAEAIIDPDGESLWNNLLNSVNVPFHGIDSIVYLGQQVSLTREVVAMEVNYLHRKGLIEIGSEEYFNFFYTQLSSIRDNYRKSYSQQSKRRIFKSLSNIMIGCTHDYGSYYSGKVSDLRLHHISLCKLVFLEYQRQLWDANASDFLSTISKFSKSDCIRIVTGSIGQDCVNCDELVKCNNIFTSFFREPFMIELYSPRYCILCVNELIPSDFSKLSQILDYNKRCGFVIVVSEAAVIWKPDHGHLLHQQSSSASIRHNNNIDSQLLAVRGKELVKILFGWRKKVVGRQFIFSSPSIGGCGAVESDQCNGCFSVGVDCNIGGNESFYQVVNPPMVTPIRSLIYPISGFLWNLTCYRHIPFYNRGLSILRMMCAIDKHTSLKLRDFHAANVKQIRKMEFEGNFSGSESVNPISTLYSLRNLLNGKIDENTANNNETLAILACEIFPLTFAFKVEFVDFQPVQSDEFEASSLQNSSQFTIDQCDSVLQAIRQSASEISQRIGSSMGFDADGTVVSKFASLLSGDESVDGEEQSKRNDLFYSCFHPSSTVFILPKIPMWIIYHLFASEETKNGDQADDLLEKILQSQELEQAIHNCYYFLHFDDFSRSKNLRQVTWDDSCSDFEKIYKKLKAKASKSRIKDDFSVNMESLRQWMNSNESLKNDAWKLIRKQLHLFLQTIQSLLPKGMTQNDLACLDDQFVGDCLVGIVAISLFDGSIATPAEFWDVSKLLIRKAKQLTMWAKEKSQMDQKAVSDFKLVLKTANDKECNRLARKKCLMNIKAVQIEKPDEVETICLEVVNRGLLQWEDFNMAGILTTIISSNQESELVKYGEFDYLQYPQQLRYDALHDSDVQGVDKRFPDSIVVSENFANCDVFMKSAKLVSHDHIIEDTELVKRNLVIERLHDDYKKTLASAMPNDIFFSCTSKESFSSGWLISLRASINVSEAINGSQSFMDTKRLAVIQEFTDKKRFQDMIHSIQQNLLSWCISLGKSLSLHSEPKDDTMEISKNVSQHYGQSREFLASVSSRIVFDSLAESEISSRNLNYMECNVMTDKEISKLKKRRQFWINSTANEAELDYSLEIDDLLPFKLPFF